MAVVLNRGVSPGMLYAWAKKVNPNLTTQQFRTGYRALPRGPDGQPIRAPGPYQRTQPKPPARPPAPRPPARPQAPRPNPLPLDPAYDMQVAGALRNYQLTGQNLAYQRQQLGQEYGFDDTSNPFNRAAMLERAYNQSATAQQANAAARGQLYSGATTANLDEGRFGYNRQYAGLRSQYADAMQRLTQQGAQAASDYQQGLGGAYADRIARALAQRPEDPGAPPGSRLPSSAAPPHPSTPKKGKQKKLSDLRRELARTRKGHGSHWSQQETQRLHEIKGEIRKVKGKRKMTFKQTTKAPFGESITPRRRRRHKNPPKHHHKPHGPGNWSI